MSTTTLKFGTLFVTVLLLTPAISVAQETITAPPSERSVAVQQWVRPSEAGAVQGLIVLPMADGSESVVRNAHIALAGPGGPVQSTSSNEKGEFVIPEVRPGIYAFSVVGTEQNAFATYAVQIVPRNSPGSENLSHFLQVSAAPLDRATVRSLLSRYLPMHPGYANQGSPEAPSFGLVSETTSNGVTASITQQNGGMDGVLWRAGKVGNGYPPAENINVFVFQDGIEVARAITDAQGRFRVNNLPTGQYALFAVGTAGIGSVGFQLVGDQPGAAAGRLSAAGKPADGTFRVASLNNRAAVNSPSFGLQLAPVGSAASSVTTASDGDINVDPGLLGPNPFAPGGGGGVAGSGGGFGGGSGGGGGGIGGAGGLLGLAGLAAGLAAISDNNDSFVPPGATSPAIPVVPIP